MSEPTPNEWQRVPPREPSYYRTPLPTAITMHPDDLAAVCTPEQIAKMEEDGHLTWLEDERGVAAHLTLYPRSHE